jgi:hypothetical protein
VYLVVYVLLGASQDRALVARTGNNLEAQHAASVAQSAQDLSIGTARVFALGEAKYDFYAELQNPNTDWYATFSYAFTWSNGSTDTNTGFILPNETRPMIFFRESSESRPGSAELVLSNIEWHRIDAHTIPNASQWLSDHGDFEITGMTYGLTPGPGTEVIPTANFSVTNHSPYRYWDAEFLLVLKTGGAVTAVNTVAIPGLEPGETRAMEVKWFGNAPASGVVTAIPAINYFDPSIYMDAPSGNPTEVLERL